MSVTWIEHRFAGGALALDVANTVVLRVRPNESFDRFENAAELPRFAEAASLFRDVELSGQRLEADNATGERDRLVRLRESVDSLFRDAVVSGHLAADRLGGFLAECAGALEKAAPEASLDGSTNSRLELAAATALSGIALLAPDQWRRIRICDNCGWLFLDRSRNGSRRWCDMTVCGNRNKAKRHYARRKGRSDDS